MRIDVCATPCRASRAIPRSRGRVTLSCMAVLSCWTDRMPRRVARHLCLAFLPRLHLCPGAWVAVAQGETPEGQSRRDCAICHPRKKPRGKPAVRALATAPQELLTGSGNSDERMRQGGSEPARLPRLQSICASRAIQRALAARDQRHPRQGGLSTSRLHTGRRARCSDPVPDFGGPLWSERGAAERRGGTRAIRTPTPPQADRACHHSD